MSTDGDDAVIGKYARQARIIIGALVAGVAIFLGIATVVDLRPGAAAGADAGRGGPPPPQPAADVGRVITWLAVGFAALTLPLSFIMPGVITSQNRRAIAAGKAAPAPDPHFGVDTNQSDTGRLAGVYMTQLIVGAAQAEGAAFFAGVAYMLGKDPIALGAAIVMVAAILVRFPTDRRVAQWIERQQELLLLERQALI
jgi:hypothetical protein